MIEFNEKAKKAMLEPRNWTILYSIDHPICILCNRLIRTIPLMCFQNSGLVAFHFSCALTKELVEGMFPDPRQEDTGFLEGDPEFSCDGFCEKCQKKCFWYNFAIETREKEMRERNLL
jgi:hypothetical protein